MYDTRPSIESSASLQFCLFCFFQFSWRTLLDDSVFLFQGDNILKYIWASFQNQ